MKAMIICFSQTGQTQRVSEKIQKGIWNAGGQCDIVPLSKISKEDLPNYDLIGLGDIAWSSEVLTRLVLGENKGKKSIGPAMTDFLI